MKLIRRFFCSCLLFALSAGHAGAAHTIADASTLDRSPALGLSDMSAPVAQLQYAPTSTPYRWQDLIVKPGDSLSTLFYRAGLDNHQWAAVLALGGAVSPLRYLQPGDIVHLRKNKDNRLQALDFSIGPLTTLSIERDDVDDLHATTRYRRPTTRRIRISAGIRHSLSDSLAAAGASPATAAQISRIFRWRVDLSRELRPGDRFAVVYTQRFIDGHRLPDGPVQAAELDLGGRKLRAFRHVDIAGRAGYFDLRGRAYALSIERAPLHYTRVSSPFSLHRRDPVLHVVRPHYGVDLVAARGTPVHAAARGVVSFRGRARGYGRLIKVNHAGGYQTRYAHLSAFAAGLHDGEHVRQDQVIGYVGASGEATGAHLHYEIRHNNRPHDPLHMKLPGGARRLTGPVFTRYSRRITSLLARLDDTVKPPIRTPLVVTRLTTDACAPYNADINQTTIPMDTEEWLFSELLCAPPPRALATLTRS